MQIYLDQDFLEGLLEVILEDLDAVYILGSGSSPTLGSAIDSFLTSNGAGKIITTSGTGVNSYIAIVWDDISAQEVVSTNSYATGNAFSFVMEGGNVPSYFVITRGASRLVSDVIPITVSSEQQAIYNSGDAPYFVRTITYSIAEEEV